MKAILFVDDHEVLARLSCEILEMHGYRAVSAFNAQDALSKFDQQDFDILVTDSSMPGMTGLELARAVRLRDPQFPIIVMTAYEPVECEHVTLWLPKNYLFPGLVEKIHFCLSAAKVEDIAR